MASALPTGTVTFLFTDIEGSTRLLHYLGDSYVAPVLLPPRLAAEREQVTARTREALGEFAFQVAFAAGEALDLNEALAEVFTS
jgi:hypothetical protein